MEVLFPEDGMIHDTGGIASEAGIFKTRTVADLFTRERDLRRDTTALCDANMIIPEGKGDSYV